MMDLEIAFDVDEQQALHSEMIATPAHQSDQQPLDMQHLGRYTLGDRELEHEILGLFTDQLPKTIAALKKAATPKDWQMSAHTLKGSARAVGAWRLAKCAAFAEKIDFPADQAARHDALTNLEAATAEACAFVANLGDA